MALKKYRYSQFQGVLKNQMGQLAKIMRRISGSGENSESLNEEEEKSMNDI